jgi:hypothetical protein
VKLISTRRSLRSPGCEPKLLLVAADPFFNSRREHLIVLTTRHAVPAIYEFREFAAELSWNMGDDD